MPIDEEVKSRQILVNYFQAGETPCEEHFRDLIKSFIHHEEDGVTICKYDTAVEECDVEEVSDIKLEAKTSDYLAYSRLHLDGLNSTASIVAGASGEMGTGDDWNNGLFGTCIDLDSNFVDGDKNGQIWLKAGEVLVEENLRVNDDADVGENLTVGLNATIGIDLTVGNDATIGRDTDIGRNLDVGNNANVTNVLTVGPGDTGVEDHLIVHGNACINGDLKVTGDMIVENTTEYNKVVLGDEKADEVQIQGVVNAGDDQEVICFESPLSLRNGINDGGTGTNDYGTLYLGEGTSTDNKFIRIKGNALEIGHSNGDCENENYDHNPQLTLDNLGTLFITSNDVSAIPALPGSAMYHLFVDGNARVNGDIYLEDGTGNPAGVLVGVNDDDLCDTSYVEWVPTSGLICDYLNANHAALNGSCSEDFQTQRLHVCGYINVDNHIDVNDYVNIGSYLNVDNHIEVNDYVNVGGYLNVDGYFSMNHPDLNDPHTNIITMSFNGPDETGNKCITADNGLLIFGTRTDPATECEDQIAMTSGGDLLIQPDFNNPLPTGYALWVGGNANITGKLDVGDLCIGGEDIEDLLVRAKNTVPVTSVSLAAGVPLPEYSEVQIDEISSIKVALAESIEVKDDHERYAYVLLEVDAIRRTAMNNFFFFTLPVQQVESLGDEYLILRTELPVSRTNPNEVEMTVVAEVLDQLKESLFKRTRMHVVLEGKQFGVGTGANEYDDFTFSLWIAPQQIALEDIGEAGPHDNNMNLPAGIALVGGDRIVVTDELLRKAQAYQRADGAPSTVYGQYPAPRTEIFQAFGFNSNNQVETPFVVDVQRIGNSMAILDSNNPGIVFLDSEGRYRDRHDIDGFGTGYTNQAADFAMDPNAVTAVVDTGQSVINVYDDKGGFLTSFTPTGAPSSFSQVKVIDLADRFLIYYPSLTASLVTEIEEFDQAGNHINTNLIDDSLGLMCSNNTDAYILRQDGLYEYFTTGLGSRVVSLPPNENVFTAVAANSTWTYLATLGSSGEGRIHNADLSSGGPYNTLTLSGFSGTLDGISTMDVDDSDNLVFASTIQGGQQFQNSLFKINKTGDRQTFAENYVDAREVVLRPTDVATDLSNNVFVLDGEKDVIKVFDENGTVIDTFAESGSLDGQLQSPQFIEIDRLGNIYTLETSSRRIQRFDNTGNHDHTWNGHYANTPFEHPLSMCVDRNGDRLYVIDRDTYRVHTLDLTASPETGWLTGSWQAPFDLSSGMTVGPHGHLLMHDMVHRNIAVYRNDGTYVTSIGGRQQGSRNITITVGMAYDEATNMLFVTNAEAATVHAIDVSNIPA